jgi:hypothetical protein
MKPTAAWLASLDLTDTLQAGQYIQAAGRLTKARLERALHQARSDPPDPRWVDLVLSWFESPPYANPFELWHTALGLLDRLADPRALEVVSSLAERPERWAEDHFGGLSGRAIHRWARVRSEHGFAAVTRPTRALADEDAAQLEQVGEALERRERGRQRDTDARARLLHAAAAGDDGALLVYADLLVDAGDVRGELIQLELAGRARTAAQRERRKSLKKRWRELTGGLAPALLHDGLRFRRGLVVGAVATAPGTADLEAVIESIDWASVEQLELRPDHQQHIEPRLVFAPHARRLRSLVLPSLEAFEAVVDCEAVQPSIREVEVLDPGEYWASRGHYPLDRLPNLERVILHGDVPQLARRFAGVEVVSA